MDYEIIWTSEAEENLYQIYDYLIENWTARETNSFFSSLREVVEILQVHPHAFRMSEVDGLREATVTKHNLSIYKVSDNRAMIVTLWDNRMNPDQRAF